MKPKNDMDINALIGERIRFYRKARGMSMEMLVKQLKTPMTQQMLAKYELGQSRWPAALIKEIAVILETDIRLFYEVKPRAEKPPSAEYYEAERYKLTLLKLPAKIRAAVYRIIDLL